MSPKFQRASPKLLDCWIAPATLEPAQAKSYGSRAWPCCWEASNHISKGPGSLKPMNPDRGGWEKVGSLKPMYPDRGGWENAGSMKPMYPNCDGWEKSGSLEPMYVFRDPPGLTDGIE
jgi:hypothetical protein